MKMSIQSRRELIKKAKKRYLKEEKNEKKRILDELEANTEMNRKYLIHLLSNRVNLKYINPINRKRRETYTMETVYFLKEIWEIFDYSCGQRLAPMLNEYIRVLEKFDELLIPDGIKKKLLKISSATIDRRLLKLRKYHKKKIFSTTKPGSMLKKQIPIKTSSWNEKRLGFGELDTVAHCGVSVEGEYVVS